MGPSAWQPSALPLGQAGSHITEANILYTNKVMSQHDPINQVDVDGDTDLARSSIAHSKPLGKNQTYGESGHA